MKRRDCGSSFMYPIEYTWIRKPTPVMISSITAVSSSNQRSRPTEKLPADSQVHAT